MLSNVDFDNSGTLSFTQFTAGSLSTENLNEESLALVFSYLDINNDNHLCLPTLW